MDANTDTELHLNCLLKLGQWKLASLETGVPVDSNTRKIILTVYNRATLVQPQSYSAWHEWGLANYRAIEEAKNSQRLARQARRMDANNNRMDSPQPQLPGSAGKGKTSVSPRILQEEILRPFVVGAAKVSNVIDIDIDKIYCRGIEDRNFYTIYYSNLGFHILFIFLNP